MRKLAPSAKVSINVEMHSNSKINHIGQMPQPPPQINFIPKQQQINCQNIQFAPAYNIHYVSGIAHQQSQKQNPPVHQNGIYQDLQNKCWSAHQHAPSLSSPLSIHPLNPTPNSDQVVQPTLLINWSIEVHFQCQVKYIILYFIRMPKGPNYALYIHPLNILSISIQIWMKKYKICQSLYYRWQNHY